MQGISIRWATLIMAMAPVSPSIPKALLFSFLITTLFFSSSSVSTTPNSTSAAAKTQRLVVKLIHPNSVHSPYYSPNDTMWERARRDLENSMARIAYLSSKTRKSSELLATNDYRASVITDIKFAGFLANISMGQPPVAQLMVMDTGSDLLWVQCLPCIQCFSQRGPIFDPSKSSTYVSLSCDSPYCHIVSPHDKCDQFGYCKYTQKYLDNTTAMGYLATETLTLETADEGTITVPDVVIGCAHVSSVDNALTSGVLGLSPQTISLVSRLGSKFSYCFGSISDPSYAYNQLIFGDGAIMEGDATPFELFHDHYYLTLESISIGEKRLNIDPATFRRTPQGTGGTIIDTGSTYTVLHEDAYSVLRDEVKSLAEGLLEGASIPSKPELLCYWGILSRDLKGFPVVTFHFAGGAELDLDIDALFRMFAPDMFCLALAQLSESPTLTLIGVLAQQYYNVGYDLVAKKVYFQRIDCQLL